MILTLRDAHHAIRTIRNNDCDERPMWICWKRPIRVTLSCALAPRTEEQQVMTIPRIGALWKLIEEPPLEGNGQVLRACPEFNIGESRRSGSMVV